MDFIWNFFSGSDATETRAQTDSEDKQIPADFDNSGGSCIVA